MNFIKWALPSILWTALLLVLTWHPKIEVPDIGFDAQDKIAHLFFFGFWGFLMCRTVSKNEINRVPYAVKVTIIAGLFFTIIDECIQGIIPGRYASVSDGIANMLGVWLSTPIFRHIWLPWRMRAEIRQDRK